MQFYMDLVSSHFYIYLLTYCSRLESTIPNLHASSEPSMLNLIHLCASLSLSQPSSSLVIGASKWSVGRYLPYSTASSYLGLHVILLLPDLLQLVLGHGMLQLLVLAVLGLHLLHLLLHHLPLLSGGVHIL